MQAKVAIIAPYPGLRVAIESVVEELGIKALIFEGDAEEGVRVARQAVAAGVEVIISRGGTARLIRDSILIPVVEIEVSAYDIIRCLIEITGQNGPVGIVGFSNIVYGSEKLGPLFGLDVKEIIVESMNEVPVKIAEAAQEGVTLIIGDVISVNYAKKLGLQVALIDSGKEAIVKAIDQGMTIADVRIREREHYELIRMVVDHSSDGIVVVDKEERITLFNPIAEKIYGVPSSEIIGSKLGEGISSPQLGKILRGELGEFSDVQEIGDKTVVMQQYRIKVHGNTCGAVANFRDVTELQRLEKIVRQKINAKGLVATKKLDDLIGGSDVMRELKTKAKRFATVDSTVFIFGESGTGKEIVAQGIHNASQRATGPFVAINCAALPESLLESELFGYEDGAFTGAKKGGKTGLFELAHNGTIFLDEIGEMPILLQSRLLRVLQERSVLKIGGQGIIPIDVRVISATNRNIFNLVKTGLFREDLFYRLNILPIFIPPLRERTGDISSLTEVFCEKYSPIKARATVVNSEAIRVLQKYQWPGNVRELQHFIERLVLLCDGKVIDANMVQRALDENGNLVNVDDVSLLKLEDSNILNIVNQVLQEENQNRDRAAKRLGISRTTLWRRLRTLQ